MKINDFVLAFIIFVGLWVIYFIYNWISERNLKKKLKKYYEEK